MRGVASGGNIQGKPDDGEGLRLAMLFARRIFEVAGENKCLLKVFPSDIGNYKKMHLGKFKMSEEKPNFISVKAVDGRVVISMDAEAAQHIGDHLRRTAEMYGYYGGNADRRPEDPAPGSLFDFGKALQREGAVIDNASKPPSTPQAEHTPGSAGILMKDLIEESKRPPAVTKPKGRNLTR